MDIYVMRHGQAEMLAASDNQRELTKHGRQEVRKMAEMLADSVHQFDYVLVSPYVRAQQTWQEVMSVIQRAGSVTSLNELTPSGDAYDIVTLVEQFEPMSQVLIISHLPLVGYLVEAFAPDAGAPLFTTAALAHLRLNDRFQGELLSLTQAH
ncbi:phosphohistidine phosphatase SixA [Celerinatantimonas sp. YJH-8]|uniref:phosphohistidine phosphatase SixA n=1 Tax=Celerinatantimonas sp. YJH-8 TaxID=3228714 RepID=UPI0038CBB374